MSTIISPLIRSTNIGAAVVFAIVIIVLRYDDIINLCAWISTQNITHLGG